MTLPIEAIVRDLNGRQREAVTAPAGPVLVIAGPGSGKTRALAHRIAYLVATGVPGRHILAVTFTNKAAGEMRARVTELLSYGPRPTVPFIGTFHGFAASLLRREAGRIGYRPNFTIYDEHDRLALMREVLKELGISVERFAPALIAAVISDLKAELVAPDEYAGRDSGEPFGRVVAALYTAYQARLAMANALDFDDLLFFAVRFLRNDPSALRRWQERFSHVHVDEYQDTSPVQYELLRLLAERHRNMFAIGDDAQSIYAWRRADYRNILNFERDWPEARTILLEENYRSTPEILHAANHLIRHNLDQKPKRLWTQNPPGARPKVRAHESERAEAAFVAEEIQHLHSGGLTPGECAVLYRTNAQSRALEEAMLERGVPYRIVGAVPFFQRREIKDLLAYLRYLSNPADHLALKRIVNVPARGIGPKTFLAHLAGRSRELGAREGAGLRRFVASVERLRREMARRPLASFLRRLITHVGYEDYLAGLGRDGESRVENVRELVSLARGYDGLDIGVAISRLLEDAALASEQDDLRDGEDRVRLMTLHAAKGLEFNTVFLTGLEEGLLPHAKSLAAGRAALEEERRLAYVGMTRAKERLYITWAVSRTIFGEREVNMPSRFLRELPPELLDSQSGLAGDSDMYVVEES